MTVAEILASLPGLTYRQLDHWLTKGYLRASGRQGRLRTLSPREVRVLRLMFQLVDAGVSPEQAVKMARSHIRTGEPIRLAGFVLHPEDDQTTVA